ncbi:hypothetical protein COCNU_12G004630 [Cocos nucifera]|uniref:Uncharacterized protein n=1 Tax=Cocos nucifera TaxID=13894 RepID=A0A8K0NB70_COCNU|nr:hypothetical protein COCNU_12G004630 [Cocos nucifera]
MQVTAWQKGSHHFSLVVVHVYEGGEKDEEHFQILRCRFKAPPHMDELVGDEALFNAGLNRADSREMRPEDATEMKQNLLRKMTASGGVSRKSKVGIASWAKVSSKDQGHLLKEIPMLDLSTGEELVARIATIVPIPSPIGPRGPTMPSAILSPIGSQGLTMPSAIPIRSSSPPKSEGGNQTRLMASPSGKALASYSTGAGDYPSGILNCRTFDDWKVVKEAIESTILPTKLREIHNRSSEEALHFFIELLNHLSEIERVRKSSLHDAATALQQVEEAIGENKHLKEALEKAALNYEETLRKASARIAEANAKVVKAEQEAEASVRKAKEQVAEIEHKTKERLADAHRLAVEDFTREWASMVVVYKVLNKLHKEMMAFSWMPTRPDIE